MSLKMAVSELAKRRERVSRAFSRGIGTKSEKFNSLIQSVNVKINQVLSGLINK